MEVCEAEGLVGVDIVASDGGGIDQCGDGGIKAGIRVGTAAGLELGPFEPRLSQTALSLRRARIVGGRAFEMGDGGGQGTFGVAAGRDLESCLRQPGITESDLGVYVVRAQLEGALGGAGRRFQARLRHGGPCR